MPTRQAAIIEIVRLFYGMVLGAKPPKKEHSFTCVKFQGTSAMCDCTAEGFNMGIEEYYRNLIDATE